ncbi:TRAP transporter small permease [Frigidibacter oleivorans]|uniref:TRAP transporter small permease n=1 Tax=Frigidibacter oleivorans TaxID=2487129 RepID=UPI0013E0C3CD|nr:TRAP transporter small permease [Frigidibacter oleivorans]
MLTWMDRLARILAALGGAVVFGVALTVTVSVVMRVLGLQGVRGDFELVEMSCVWAAGLFLPLCQLKRGHVMVDLFTNWLAYRVRAVIDWIWLIGFALAWAALCYFTVHGLAEIRAYGDQTMLLSIPVWWAYVPSVLGTGAASLIAFAQATLLPREAVSEVGH